jgi:hypothetical protein
MQNLKVELLNLLEFQQKKKQFNLCQNDKGAIIINVMLNLVS